MATVRARTILLAGVYLLSIRRASGAHGMARARGRLGTLRNSSKWAFTAERGRSKARLDEAKPSIRRGGRLDNTRERDDIQVCLITWFDYSPTMKCVSCLFLACLILGCSRQLPVDFTPPTGWSRTSPNVQVAGLTPLFVGQREESDGTVSTMSVAHAPTAKQRNGARDLIGACLDSFWRVDTNLFNGQKLEALRLSGHTVLYDRAPSVESAPSMGSTHTYFLMTEDGVYAVVYRTLSDRRFDVSQLLENSLRIRCKDAAFADELAQYWIDALARVQSGVRTNAPHSQIEQAAPPNGGPAGALRDSEAGAGPPSVT